MVDYPVFDSDGDGDVDGADRAVEYVYHADDADERFDGNPVALRTGKVRMSGTSLAAPLYAACLVGAREGDPNPIC